MEIEDTLFRIKKEMEHSITTATYNGEQKRNGLEAKKALICSSGLINHIHEYVKKDLIHNGVKATSIFPPIGKTKPELKVTGMLKQKKQDIAIKPIHLNYAKERVTWGPLAHEDKWDNLGRNLTEQMMTINVRSQMSSVSKNADTLFERTYAESSNLHEIHKKMVLGEVFLIPTHEYCEEQMRNNQVAFKEKRVNIEKYISFFSQISGRESEYDSPLKYERCALLIVDFRQERPKLYKSTEALKEDGLLSRDFNVDMRMLDVEHFIPDMLMMYHQRFNVLNFA